MATENTLPLSNSGLETNDNSELVPKEEENIPNENSPNCSSPEEESSSPEHTGAQTVEVEQAEQPTETPPEIVQEPPSEPATGEKEESVEDDPTTIENVLLEEDKTETPSSGGENLSADNSDTKQQEDSVENQDRPTEEEANVSFVVGDEEEGKEENEELPVEVKSKPKRSVCYDYHYRYHNLTESHLLHLVILQRAVKHLR